MAVVIWHPKRETQTLLIILNDPGLYYISLWGECCSSEESCFLMLDPGRWVERPTAAPPKNGSGSGEETGCGCLALFSYWTWDGMRRCSCRGIRRQEWRWRQDLETGPGSFPAELSGMEAGPVGRRGEDQWLKRERWESQQGAAATVKVSVSLVPPAALQPNLISTLHASDRPRGPDTGPRPPRPTPCTVMPAVLGGGVSPSKLTAAVSATLPATTEIGPSATVSDLPESAATASSVAPPVVALPEPVKALVSAAASPAAAPTSLSKPAAAYSTSEPAAASVPPSTATRPPDSAAYTGPSAWIAEVIEEKKAREQEIWGLLHEKGEAGTSAPRSYGRLVYMDTGKGYGFIRDNTGCKVYVNVASIRHSQVPQPGDLVSYYKEYCLCGYYAVTVIAYPEGYKPP